MLDRHSFRPDLEDGHPVVGARVRRLGHAQIADTDVQGTAILKAVDGGVLLVEKGADRCLLNLDHLGSRRQGMEPKDKIFLDARPRPGQPVQLRGWFKGCQEVAFQLEELAQGRLQPDRWGGISLDVPLPPTQAKTVELTLNGKKAECFWLEQAEPGKSFVSGDEGLILNSDVGPEVHWELSTTPVEFSPKGFDDFHFGVETRPTDRRLNFTTQIQGNPIRLRAQTLGLPSCWQAHCLARLGDVEKSSYCLIHPGNVYVGLKGDAYIESGEPLRWQAVTCDPAGQPVGGISIEGTVQPKERECRVGHWSTRWGPKIRFSARTDSRGMAQCQTRPMPPGNYQITVHAQDDQARVGASQLDLTVSGSHDPASRNNSQDILDLVNMPGKLLVQSPLYPARGRLVASDGTTQFFEQTGPSVALPVHQRTRTDCLVEVVSADKIVSTAGSGELKNGLAVRLTSAGHALLVDVGTGGGEYSGVVHIDNCPYTWVNERSDELPELTRRSTRESLVRDNFSRMQLQREYGNAGTWTTLAAWDTESQHDIDQAFTRTDNPTVDEPRYSTLVPMFHTDARGHARVPFTVPPGRYRASVTVTDGHWHFGQAECRIWKPAAAAVKK